VKTERLTLQPTMAKPKKLEPNMTADGELACRYRTPWLASHSQCCELLDREHLDREIPEPPKQLDFLEELT
jgi:hypothetical protein